MVGLPYIYISIYLSIHGWRENVPSFAASPPGWIPTTQRPEPLMAIIGIQSVSDLFYLISGFEKQIYNYAPIICFVYDNIYAIFTKKFFIK